MAEVDVLTQAAAEGVNLKAAGVTVADAVPPIDAAQSLLDDIKQFASSPQGQALTQVQEKPVEAVQERPDGTQALLADLQKFQSPAQGSSPAQAPEQSIENQPKR